IVGEGDRLASAAQRGRGDRLGRRLVLQAVGGTRLRDIPVLAELAGEIAPRGAEREHRSAGKEMIEGVLLDRIDAESGRAAVGGEHHPVALTRAHETQTALAFVQPAIARAQVALDAPILEPVPITARRAREETLIHERSGLTLGKTTFIWRCPRRRATG